MVAQRDKHDSRRLVHCVTTRNGYWLVLMAQGLRTGFGATWRTDLWSLYWCTVYISSCVLNRTSGVPALAFPCCTHSHDILPENTMYSLLTGAHAPAGLSELRLPLLWSLLLSLLLLWTEPPGPKNYPPVNVAIPLEHGWPRGLDVDTALLFLRAQGFRVPYVHQWTILTGS